MSLINGLEIGKRSLNAYRSAITVTGHNISNLENQNYTRQEPSLASSTPISGIPSGVDIEQIQRQRDNLIDTRYRSEMSDLGKWDAQTGYLQNIEAVVGQMDSGGLSDLLNKFWNSWHDLANTPESQPARIVVLQTGVALSERLNQVSSSLSDIRSNLNERIDEKFSEANDLISQIESFNLEIARLVRSGADASDLQDVRDKAVDDLARLIKIETKDEADGTISVRFGGIKLVDSISNSALQFTKSGDSYTLTAQNGVPINFESGEIGGLIDLRDNKLAEISERIDEMSESLIETVNSIHSGGYGLDNTTGINFFEGSDASNIAVNPELLESPEKLAASANPDSPGDNSVALAIAENRRNFADQYNAIVVAIGGYVESAETGLDNATVLIEQVDAFRQGEFGVSLDEELSNLIRFQRAYQAAAKFVSTLDEMLQTLVNIK